MMFLPSRPPANVAAFRGPAYGFWAISVMPGLLAFFVLQSLVPVLKNGVDIWLASILPVIGSAGVFALIFMFGLLRRKSWYSPVALGFGWMLMVAYALSLGLGLAILLGVAPRAADLKFMSVVNVILWILFSPLNILLWRLTHRDSWRKLPAKGAAASPSAA